MLAPEKCWCYIKDFHFKQGRWTTMEAQENHTLFIRTLTGTNHKYNIQQIHTNQGSNMLGVIMALNGDNTHHVEFLRSKAQKWAANIKATGTNIEEVWTAVHRTIPFSLGYSLLAVTISRNDCTHIIGPIVKTGLPRAGIPATIPTPVWYGPLESGGLGILDQYVSQGAAQIASMVTHLWSRSPTGKLLDIAIQDLVLEMGIANISRVPTLKIGLSYATTNSWIRHIVEFMSAYAINTQLLRQPLTPHREKDFTIMEAAMEYMTNKLTLRALNRVHMQLHILWMSDILRADGTTIDTRWERKQGPHPSETIITGLSNTTLHQRIGNTGSDGYNKFRGCINKVSPWDAGLQPDISGRTHGIA